MASKTSSPVTGEPETDNEPKRPLMPRILLEATINENETDLKQLLGLNDNEQDHPPHTKISVEDVTQMKPSECLRSATGTDNTILHILSANGHQHLVGTICKKDSSLIKACNARNETPFHHAARFGHDNTIRILTDHAKRNFGEAGFKDLLRQKNCVGETALHEAARHGNVAVVSTLMEADLELAGLVNDDFVSSLYLATARGSLDMVKNMVEKLSGHEITPTFYSGPRKQTALHAAVLQDQEITKELLNLYSETLGKAVDATGRTPFHFITSTRSGDHVMAKLLLDKDLSLAYNKASDGSFPVHTAVRMGHAKIIVLLLQRCLDSGELLDGNGRNFLHIAIEAKKSNVILKLLKDSKNNLPVSHWNKMFNEMVHTMDNKGNTPLHLAAEHGSVGFMYSLLEYDKLDLTLENKEGLTAFDISVIQLTESERKIKSTDLLCGYHVRDRRARFSTGWFHHYTKEKMPKTESSIKDQVPEVEPTGGTNQDNILTMDARGAKKRLDSMIDKAQLVGLGSVLIATVSFAAAFTLPGGTNQDTGTPIPGKEYFMKAFVLADFSAFFLSFLSTMQLIYSSSDHNSARMEMYVAKALTLFAIAAKCMVMALTLALYMVLAPVSKTTVTIIFVFCLFLLVLENPNGVQEHYRRYRVRTILKHILAEGSNRSTPPSPDSNSTVSCHRFKTMFSILNHIPYGASCVKPVYFGINREIRYFLYKRYVPIFAPLIFIFALALL